MAKKLFGTKLCAAALATFALASCQSESTLLEPAADNMRDVMLTVTASKGELTRTNLDLSDDQKAILLTWNLGDEIQVCEEDGRYAGVLQVTGFADEEHTQAKFEGKVRMLDKDGTHNLSFYYLGKEAEYKAIRGRQMPDMVYDLAAQTYSDVHALAANDLLIDECEVEVTKGEATFKSLFMKRQFAYGRFTLLYNNEPLQFGENTVITINTENNDIKTGATLAFPNELTATGNGSISLSAAENDFYVALIPGSSESKIKFNVTINDDVYEGYSNSYLIEKNDFLRKANGLTVAEALPINVKKTDGSDDEHEFALVYNKNFGSNDAWTDWQNGVGLKYTYTLSNYEKIFNDKDGINEGYDFIGWTLNQDGTGDLLLPNSALEVTLEGATVYAQWKKTVYVYTLNWEDNDGNPIDSKTVDSDKDPYIWAVENKTAEQAAPEGYEFAGWAEKGTNDVVEKVTFTKENKEITVVPVYTEKEYTWTVTWKDGYKGDIKTETVKGTNGKNIENLYPADPTREGYTFAGWAPQVTKLSKDKLNVEIVAQWEQSKYDLKVIAWNNDGTNNNQTAADHNVVLPHEFYLDNLDDVKRTGYTFVGWGATADAKSPIEKVTFTSKDDINVYAIWKKDTSSGTITAPGAGGTGY